MKYENSDAKNCLPEYYYQKQRECRKLNGLDSRTAATQLKLRASLYIKRTTSQDDGRFGFLKTDEWIGFRSSRSEMFIE